jgi:hypothetical protein
MYKDGSYASAPQTFLEDGDCGDVDPASAVPDGHLCTVENGGEPD